MAVATTTVRSNARKTTNGFWWANLSSSDDAAAAEFYSQVFGWSYEEFPFAEGMVHRNATLDGHRIAGIDPLMPDSEWPTAWTNYVFVSDIDAVLGRVEQLGGTIAAGSMDVMGEGHLAVIIDPQGAALGLWQPGRHTGADAVNQPGTYTWVELTTDDIDGAKRFYGELFGWGFERVDMEMEYWLVSLDGVQFAGIMGKPEGMANAPSMWWTYFGTADIDATVEAITSNGGTILFGPQRMGPGVGSVAVDPQGGHFFAFQLDEWPQV